MKLIIDIDENVFTRLFDCGTENTIDLDRIKVCNAIRKGTPIPDNVTNGDVIKVLFEPNLIRRIGNVVREEYEFDVDWWNSPYREAVSDDTFNVQSNKKVTTK